MLKTAKQTQADNDIVHFYIKVKEFHDTRDGEGFMKNYPRSLEEIRKRYKYSKPGLMNRVRILTEQAKVERLSLSPFRGLYRK